MGANTVSDDIVENTEDTMTLLSKYIRELDTSLDKDRLINYQRQLYTEAQDLEIWFILIMWGGETFSPQAILLQRYN